MSSLTKPGARGAASASISAQRKYWKWAKIPKRQSSDSKTVLAAGSANSDAPILLFK